MDEVIGTLGGMNAAIIGIEIGTGTAITEIETATIEVGIEIETEITGIEIETGTGASEAVEIRTARVVKAKAINRQLA